MSSSRPAVSSAGGPSREMALEWDGLVDSLPQIVRELNLGVLIVERPAPGWAQIELLDFRGRPIGLRLHDLGAGEDGTPRVEARCWAGRFGDDNLELAILDAIESSGG